ncbi:MAG: hypothetical protein M1832_000812 [Thelocarpon impressellum]|nr:MAG: hypothetical protein M1832_000812 [Thelocarpon impressellum]
MGDNSQIVTGFSVPRGPDFRDTFNVGDQVTLRWNFTQDCGITIRLHQPFDTSQPDTYLVSNAASSLRAYTWTIAKATDLSDPRYKLKLGCDNDQVDFTSSPAFILTDKVDPSSTTATEPAEATSASVARFTASATARTSSDAGSDESSPAGLSLGVKLGLGIGVPLVALVAAVYAYVVLRYCRRRRQAAKAPPPYSKYEVDEVGGSSRGVSPIALVGAPPQYPPPAPPPLISYPSEEPPQESPMPEELAANELDGAAYAELEGDWPIQEPQTPLPPIPLSFPRKERQRKTSETPTVKSRKGSDATTGIRKGSNATVTHTRNGSEVSVGHTRNGSSVTAGLRKGSDATAFHARNGSGATGFHTRSGSESTVVNTINGSVVTSLDMRREFDTLPGKPWSTTVSPVEARRESDTPPPKPRKNSDTPKPRQVGKAGTSAARPRKSSLTPKSPPPLPRSKPPEIPKTPAVEDAAPRRPSVRFEGDVRGEPSDW